MVAIHEQIVCLEIDNIKVARYSFSGSVPAKFEHKLRR